MKMNIALVAHDEMKNTMVGFCIAYEEILKKYGNLFVSMVYFISNCFKFIRSIRKRSTLWQKKDQFMN